MARNDFGDRMRNVKYITTEERDELKKSHVLLTSDKMTQLTSDINAAIEKGVSDEGLSKEEADNLKEVSRQHSQAEPVTIYGSGVVEFAIPKVEQKEV